MKKFRTLAVAALCLLLCACTQQEQHEGSSQPPATTTAPTLPGEMTCSVTILDPNGDPVTSGVVVNFISGTDNAAMQIVNGQGVAEKVLPTGTYSVELGFTDSSLSYHYELSEPLTAEKPSVTIVLSHALQDSSMSLNAYSAAKGKYVDYTAHFLGTGCTYVPLDQTDRTYVIFVPQESGMYEFSVLNGTAVLGYYGSEHFVLPESAAVPEDDGSFRINVSKGMIGTEGGGTAMMVLGIDARDNDACILSIQRIGAAELTIDDMPWDVYQTKAELSAFNLPDTVTIQEFDLKKPAGSYELVKDGDGIYHLGAVDGPVVYAKLGCSAVYLDSIQFVIDNAGMYRYFYDENGEFVRKEGYTQSVREYLDVMDQASGLYPLTEDLVYIFKNHGEFVGWWDPNSPGYLFEDGNGDPIPGINHDNAWLFLCCYGETDPDDPCKDGHKEVTDDPKAPTCTDSGLTAGKHCTVCGKVTVAQETVKATGHAYGDWKQIQPPTADSQGLAERVCGTCGYTQQKPLDKLDNEDPQPDKELGKPANSGAPVELAGEAALSFDAQVKPGEYMIYHINRLTGVYLTIEDEYAYVVYGDQLYWPENGKISVLITNDSFYFPAEVWIGNFGTEERTIHADCLYPLGDMMNPEALTLGSFTTTLPKGNDQGYYYTFVAEADGTLTIDLGQVSDGVNCSVTLYNLNSYAYVMMENGRASVQVRKGEMVQINIALSTDSFEFPGGTVTATAAFE